MGEDKRAKDPSKIIFLDVDGVLNGVNLELQKRIDRLPKFIRTIMRRFCRRHGGHLPFMPAQMARLQRIVYETGAIIVLSSAWRKLMDDHRFADIINSAMAKYGLAIESCTGTDPSGWRENEIFKWLADSAEKENFFGANIPFAFTADIWAERDPRAWIAIDDDFQDMQEIDRMGRLIRTSFFSRKYGLQDDHVQRAIDILNRPLREKP
jgi:hypothetical protein